MRNPGAAPSATSSALLQPPGRSGGLLLTVFLREQRIEPADSRTEHLRHDALDIAALPLREERDVERDLARRHLGDRLRLAHDGRVAVGGLGRADERSAI